MMNEPTERLSQRYHLLTLLGHGGMGMVYRAYDRLTGQTVALKQVQVAPQALDFATRAATNDTNALLLTLAQEFKLLASLHHPNIISVLDYGFDANRQPYFTMELLAESQTLLEAGRGQPLAVQIDLLIQTLQALTYLHRCGILHRDLKPDNVLVSHGRVRVLDFGLSVIRAQAAQTDVSGTLLYLAPEVLEGGKHSEAADLYSIGVMFYELLVGSHPFHSDQVGALLMRVLEEEPDLTPLVGLTPAGAKRTLPALLLRLLSKQPAMRHATAEAVIADLWRVLGQPPPPESLTIRESFLQAATFVGRETELAQLTTTLTTARQGQGGGWLIGGESGVGKSRLLDELRIHALVEGMQVLRGQAVEGNGLPYQLWREPLRRLVLTTEVSDLEAGILQPLIPDLAQLLQRPIPPVADVEGQAAQQRLQMVIVDLCRRQPQPTLLILEDLQWVTESLEPLRLLLSGLEQLPWLIVATYRNEERQHLPDELPTLRVMTLPRLGASAIGELSAAILGEAGKQPQVLSLIQRESEGNAFFVVEVVRALAEATGRLTTIGREALPDNLLAGGIQQLLRRRLARVPTWAQATLKLAAVAGRQLDRAVLLAASPELDWSTWVIAGAEAAVLEFVDGAWRFTHDKLRATLLADLDGSEQVKLHEQIARAIETVYPGDLAYAETLVEHWVRANVPTKALVYIVQVVDRFIHITANYTGAEALIARGLDYGETTHKATLLRLAGEAKRYQDDYAGAITHYTASLALNEDNPIERAATLNGLGSALQMQGDHAAAAAYLQQALATARAANDQPNLALGSYYAGGLADAQSQYELAKQHYNESLALWRTLGNVWGQSKALTRLGIIASKEGNRLLARTHFEASLQINQQIGDRTGLVVSLMSLGILSEELGEFTVARAYYDESLQVATSINDRQFMALGQYNLGCSYLNEGAYLTALPYFEASLLRFAEIGDRDRVALSYANLGLVAYAQGTYATARKHLERSIAIERELGEQDLLAIHQAELVLVLLQLGEFPAAQATLQEAITLALAVAMPAPQARVLLAAAYMAYATGAEEQAAQWLGAVRLSPMMEGRTVALLQTLAAAVEPALGATRFAAALQQGQTQTITACLQTALMGMGPATTIA